MMKLHQEIAVAEAAYAAAARKVTGDGRGARTPFGHLVKAKGLKALMEERDRAIREAEAFDAAIKGLPPYLLTEHGMPGPNQVGKARAAAKTIAAMPPKPAAAESRRGAFDHLRPSSPCAATTTGWGKQEMPNKTETSPALKTVRDPAREFADAVQRAVAMRENRAPAALIAGPTQHRRRVSGDEIPEAARAAGKI